MSNNTFTFIFTRQSTDAVPILTEVVPTARINSSRANTALQVLVPKQNSSKSQLSFEQVPDKISLGQRLLISPENLVFLNAVRCLVWEGTEEHGETRTVFSSGIEQPSAWDKRVGLGSAFLDPSSSDHLAVLAWDASGFCHARERIWAEIQLFIQLLIEHKQANISGLRKVANEIAGEFQLSPDAVQATWSSHLLRTAAFNPVMLSAHKRAVSNAKASLHSLK
ncbi:hypothetical protein [Corynebacterium striatum]|uniref:hypothetical protein n=1 Tax=Corynebacterium striatum TaxID=43770 RepID=UPI0027BA6E02|nr:hypothetical protein [Corynebacterium striatum]